MKKIYFSIVLLASLILGACSSDGDSDGGNKNTVYTVTPQGEAPVWQIDWNHNQERPNWPDLIVNFSEIYANWTIVMVQIEEELQPYVSEDDLVAIFVNGELRGLAYPATTVDDNQTETGTFIVKAWGNETGSDIVNISLQYYCQTLKQIFTLSDDISLDSDETTGIDEDYIPSFTLGSAKYPIVKTVNVETILTKAGITSIQENMVGAFVGEECRGKTALSANSNTQLVIYGRSAGESVTLKYYDAAGKVLYTLPDAVKM